MHPSDLGAAWLIGAIPLWAALSWGIAQLGGWGTLAPLYRAAAGGERGQLSSIAMRWSIRYNNCVWLRADPTALHLSVLFVVRIGHPPLSIPWIDLSIRDHARDWFGRVRIDIAQAPDVPLRLRETLARDLAAASGGRFVIPLLGQPVAR